MNEMIERIARSLARCHFMRKRHVGFCTQEERVSWLVNAYWHTWVPDAKALLKDIREPTDHMLVAAEIVEPSLQCFFDKEKSPAYIVWQAMIDEASNEDQ